MTEHAARATSFDTTAEQYERGRPGYPQQLLDLLFAEIGLDQPRILDLGAGTGKLTRRLRAFGPVTAVEPLAAMRAQLGRVVPDVECLDGTAESIPLPDGAVDVVTVGQAYHWFDQDRANPEIWRVLSAGGHLVSLWNTETREVPWLAALDEIMTRGEQRPDKPMQPGWWCEMFQHEPWFSAPVVREGAMAVATTKQQLLDRMESHSYLSVRAPGARRPVLDEVAALIAPLPDPFEVPYSTEAYWCRKLPPSAS